MYHFLPKSAGISPHCFVSHFSMGVSYLFSANHFSARSINRKSSSVFSLRSNLVLHYFFFTQLMAFTLSL